MKTFILASLALSLDAAAAGAVVDESKVPGHLPTLMIRDLSSGAALGRLRVGTAAFQQGGRIPVDNTQYGANLFPGLFWSAGPKKTHSYAVVVQGIAAPGAVEGGITSVHLSVYNIRPDARSLPEDLSRPPSGSRFGPSIHGVEGGYAGPHAHDTIQHNYHFQVFALDTMIAPPGTVAELAGAIRGHVLASGETIGIAAGSSLAATKNPVQE